MTLLGNSFRYTKQCERCNHPFGTNNKGARFCGLKCSSAWNSERVLSMRKDCVCCFCGVSFKLNPKSKRAGKFCTRDCSFKSKARIKSERESLKRIKENNSADQLKSEHNKVKSVTKRVVIAYIAFLLRKIRNRKTSQSYCGDCGVPTGLKFGMPSRMRCRDCSRERAKSTESYRASKRRSKAKRKAIERGAVTAEKIDPLLVLSRGMWRCYICGISTPKSLRGTNSDNAPEVDHVHPISRGGSHSYDNLACICRSCNSKKSNLMLHEFLHEQRGIGGMPNVEIDFEK